MTAMQEAFRKAGPVEKALTKEEQERCWREKEAFAIIRIAKMKGEDRYGY